MDTTSDASNPPSRRELTAAYKRAHPEAGVYLIRNRETQRVLLGSAPNLASMRNKVAFARSTKTASALPMQLAADARTYGLDAFEFEVLEAVQPPPEQTAAEVRADLDALESLWRERFDPGLLY